MTAVPAKFAVAAAVVAPLRRRGQLSSAQRSSRGCSRALAGRGEQQMLRVGDEGTHICHPITLHLPPLPEPSVRDADGGVGRHGARARARCRLHRHDTGRRARPGQAHRRVVVALLLPDLRRGGVRDRPPARHHVGRPGRRQALGGDVLPDPGRGRRLAAPRPLARADGQRHRGRPHLLHPLPLWRPRPRRPLDGAPLRHVPARVVDFDHHCGVRPLHRGDGFAGNMGYFKTILRDGRRRRDHVHRRHLRRVFGQPAGRHHPPYGSVKHG